MDNDKNQGVQTSSDLRPPFYRRTFVIHPEFQSTLIAYFVLVAALVIAIFFIAHLYSFARFLTFTEQLGLKQTDPVFLALLEQKNFLNVIYGIASVTVLLVITISGVFISHRIAGPLHRLKITMLEPKTAKDLSTVKFRDRDFFHDLADAYNKHVEYLRKD